MADNLVILTQEDAAKIADALMHAMDYLEGERQEEMAWRLTKQRTSSPIIRAVSGAFLAMSEAGAELPEDDMEGCDVLGDDGKHETADHSCQGDRIHICENAQYADEVNLVDE